MAGSYIPVVRNLAERSRRLRLRMKKAGHEWAGELSEILEGTDMNIRDLYRKRMQEEAPAGGGGGGGGGGRAKVALCTFTLESERFGWVKLEDGTYRFDAMQPVVFSKWEREPVRQLFGTYGAHSPRRITGSLWVETLDGGITEKRYYIDMRASTPHGVIGAGALLGFTLGFGRYGTERCQLRCDMYEYRRTPGDGAELKYLQNAVHRSSKWQTNEADDGASGTLLTDALLTKYTAEGLRLKTTLTVWA